MSSGTTSQTDCESSSSVSGAKRSSESCEEEPPRKILPTPGSSSERGARRGQQTELHRAAARGAVQSVEELLARGFDTRARDAYGMTPLHSALQSRQEAAAELLADSDDSNDVRSSAGRTPLALAASEEYLGVIQRLLFGGVHPHQRGPRGRHILEGSLKRGREDIAEAILAMCAWKDVAVDFNKMRLWTDEVQWCKDVLAQCREEIRRMRETGPDGARVSYYDLARRHASRIAPSEGVLRALRSDRPRSVFPRYAELLAFRARKAEERRALARRCLECFALVSLPPTIADTVLLFLDERDMRSFIDAFEFPR